ncbi:MAG: NusA-like transcription termination signal-binding factor [Desulfurococcaceae archaeon]
MASDRPQLKITPDELRYMALLHELSGVYVHDCIIDEENNRLIFLVDPNDIGKAIGPKGALIQRLRKLLNKNIEIVGYSEDLDKLVKFALAPARVREVKFQVRPDGRKVVYVSVEPSDKAIAIGKNGRNVSKARLIVRRYYGVDALVIA